MISFQSLSRAKFPWKVFCIIAGAVLLIQIFLLIQRETRIYAQLQLKRAAREVEVPGGKIIAYSNENRRVANAKESAAAVAFFPRRIPVLPRKNMQKCEQVYGKLIIFVGIDENAFVSLYKLAIDSLRCYLATTDYDLRIVNLNTDARVRKHCNHSMLYFRKHCAASLYLEEADWMLVLDADTMVVNPNHCIEEYIDPRVNFVFYERFFNYEIMSGNYLVRNSKFSRDFLMKWADYEFYVTSGSVWFSGYDNGALHIAILESILSQNAQQVINCDKIWKKAHSYEEYMLYVICVRIYLGTTNVFPGKFKLLRRAHSFARDGFLTQHKWCPLDFMFHGVKQMIVGQDGEESSFKRDFNVSECGDGLNGWHWRKDRRVDVNAMKVLLRNSENYVAKAFINKTIPIPFIWLPDIGECFPNCGDEVESNDSNSRPTWKPRGMVERKPVDEDGQPRLTPFEVFVRNNRNLYAKLEPDERNAQMLKLFGQLSNEEMQLLIVLASDSFS